MALKQAALKIRENAYAPYSGFQVGVALRSSSGEVYTGVNVENAAYPEGTCAEAGAIARMIAALRLSPAATKYCSNSTWVISVTQFILKYFNTLTL